MGQCLGLPHERRQKLRIPSCLWSQGDVKDFILLGDIDAYHSTLQTDGLELKVTSEVRSGGGVLPGSLPCL